MNVKATFALLVCLPTGLFSQAASQRTGVDTAAMDRAADPCADFYQYACGNWITAHPLPADRARYGRFAELQDRNENELLNILRSAAVPKAERTAIEQKIGDYYASCMNTDAINRNGLGPVKAELERIDAMASAAGVVNEMARLHSMGVNVVFRFTSGPDSKDSSRTIAGLSQGGLSLPDRDYYLNEDAKFVEIRRRFFEHVKNMFQLAGDGPEQAAAEAQQVMQVEMVLARASMDRVTMRDPNATYHIMKKQELEALAPLFPWAQYFAATGAPAFETIDVEQPEFIRDAIATLGQTNVNAGKPYFRYRLLRAYAGHLPEAFEKEDFDFYQRVLSGVQQPRPRERRCAAAVDSALGDLLGQKYVEIAFGPAAKARISQLVDSIEKSMGADIRSLAWMTDATKKAALTKLQAITNNVGYPKKWRDYSKVAIAPDDYAGNSIRAAQAMYQQRLEKIGKPTDKSEWSMTAPTVNAFYSPSNNSINFPAGILQLPFFDPNRDMAVNLGGIGAVIGHEITHGFDDSGRKFDADGNLRDWWTAQDAAEFEKRTSCLVDEYAKFIWKGDVKLNGKLTIGENAADSGGVRVGYGAMQDLYRNDEAKIDGLTPEQRFFLGFAQVWCENMSSEEARNRALTDPHSPGRFRVNGTFQNFPEFQKAFSCKAGQPMVSANACRVW
jgi:putative endopeptidase